jgi:hypothetical protein
MYGCLKAFFSLHIFQRYIYYIFLILRAGGLLFASTRASNFLKNFLINNFPLPLENTAGTNSAGYPCRRISGYFIYLNCIYYGNIFAQNQGVSLR